MAEGDPTGGGVERPPFKPPRRIPPPSHRALQQVVSRYAAYHGLAPNRVQRWISFMVLGAALSRIEHEETGPTFLVKGGVSLEVRLRMRARATKDFDTVYRGERDKLLQTLADAFAEPYAGFTFRVDEVRELVQMTRIEIKIEYQGRTWSSTAVEISPDEGVALPAEDVPAISLIDFGLKGPATLPCLPLTKQVAQKLHAMTETFEGRPNDRFRDLVDLWVLRELVPPTVELREMWVRAVGHVMAEEARIIEDALLDPPARPRDRPPRANDGSPNARAAPTRARGTEACPCVGHDPFRRA